VNQTKIHCVQRTFLVFFLSQKIAEAVDVAALSPDETTDILSECGLTVSLTVSN